MRKRTIRSPKILIGILALVAVAVALSFIPRIHNALAWRLDDLRAQIIYLIHPPEVVAFHPSGQSAATPTSDGATPAQTPTPTGTPIPSELATSTVTATPPPNQFILTNVTFVDQMGRYNYCGPANLAMALSYWGWTGDPASPYDLRDQIALVVKPGEEDPAKSFVERGNSDVNVMPYELVDYVNEKTSLRALFRYGGDIDLVKRLIAAGFPVITEKGIYEPLLPDYSVQWGGHYSFTTGYDDQTQEFTWQDSYLPDPTSVGKNSRSLYTDYKTNWRAFDYVFIVVYPADREQDLIQVLGPWADKFWAAQHALDIANTEINSQQLTGNDLFFAMFNRVTSMINLENPDYGPAGASFDEANAYYNDQLIQTMGKKIPYRIMWYQTAPYPAYYYSGRYQDVINLANQNLTERITPPRSLEESWFWLSRAEYALGEYDQAYAHMRTALYYHPGFQPALDMLSLWGVTP